MTSTAGICLHLEVAPGATRIHLVEAQFKGAGPGAARGCGPFAPAAGLPST